MHKIYWPSLGFDRLDYWLHHPRSVEALEAMGDQLTPGVHVVLCGPEGMELAVRLEWQAEVNCWVAYPLGSA